MRLVHTRLLTGTTLASQALSGRRICIVQAIGLDCKECAHIMAFHHIIILACNWCSGFEQVTAAVCLFAQRIIVTGGAGPCANRGGPWAWHIRTCECVSLILGHYKLKRTLWLCPLVCCTPSVYSVCRFLCVACPATSNGGGPEEAKSCFNSSEGSCTSLMQLCSCR